MSAREIAASVSRAFIHYSPHWQSLRRTAGQHRSAFVGAGSELKKIGEWEEVKNARGLNLNASLRAGKFLFNIREEEKSIDVVVLMDLSRSEWFGQPTKRERAAQVAAAFANTTKKLSDPFTLIVFADDAKVILAGEYGKHLPLQVAEKILQHEPRGFGSRGLERAVGLLPTIPSIVVFASDFLPPKRFLQQLGIMKGFGHEVVPVVFRDRWELQLPKASGFLEVTDAETGEEAVAWLSTTTRQQFLQTTELALQELTALFSQTRTKPVMLLPGVDPVKALNRHFSSRPVI